MGPRAQGGPCPVPAWAKAEVSFQMALVAVGGCRVTLMVGMWTGSAPCASAAPGPRAGAVPVVARSALAWSCCFGNTWMLGGRGGCCACWQPNGGLGVGSPHQAGGQQPALSISCISDLGGVQDSLCSEGGGEHEGPYMWVPCSMLLWRQSSERAAQPAAVTQPCVGSSPVPLVPTDDIALQGLNEAGIQHHETESAEDRSLSSTVN